MSLILRAASIRPLKLRAASLLPLKLRAASLLPLKLRAASLLPVVIAFSASTFAAETPATTPKVITEGEATKHSFDDLLIQGKYHFSDEAVTTVEDDKVLDSLIGVRTDFKDRLEQSAERY